MGLSIFANFLQYVTIEPCFFFEFLSFEISNFLSQNLYLQKVCRNDTSHEPDLKTKCDDETRGAAFTTGIYGTSFMFSIFLSLIFTLFASSYSDMAGKKRKIFVLVALFGLMLRTVWMILQTIYWSWSPLLGVIINVLVPDVFGGFLSLNNFIMAHLFDITTNENRLTRITVLSVVQSLALLLGKMCSGYLLRQRGFLFSYSLCIGLELLAAICAVIFIKEEASPTKNEVNLKQVFSLKETFKMFDLILTAKEKPKLHLVSIWMLQAINTFVFSVRFGTCRSYP